MGYLAPVRAVGPDGRAYEGVRASGDPRLERVVERATHEGPPAADEDADPAGSDGSDGGGVHQVPDEQWFVLWCPPSPGRATAVRVFDAAHTLRAHGLAVARPLACLGRSRWPWQPTAWSLLVLEPLRPWLPWARVVGAGPSADTCRALGRALRQMHDAGFALGETPPERLGWVDSQPGLQDPTRLVAWTPRSGAEDLVRFGAALTPWQRARVLRGYTRADAAPAAHRRALVHRTGLRPSRVAL